MSILLLDSKSNPVMQLQTLSTVIAVVCKLAFVLLYRLQVMYVQQLGDTCVSQSSMYVWRRHHMLKTFLNAYIHSTYIYSTYIVHTYIHTYCNTCQQIQWVNGIKSVQQHCMQTQICTTSRPVGTVLKLVGTSNFNQSKGFF